MIAPFEAAYYLLQALAIALYNGGQRLFHLITPSTRTYAKEEKPKKRSRAKKKAKIQELRSEMGLTKRGRKTKNKG